jgi:hypothetical protein
MYHSEEVISGFTPAKGERERSKRGKHGMQEAVTGSRGIHRAQEASGLNCHRSEEAMDVPRKKVVPHSGR